MTALASTSVPVPAALAEEPTGRVLGAPFVVLEHVDGIVVRDPTIAAQLPPGRRRDVALDVVDCLAALHSVEPASVGLQNLGPSGGYLQRQLRRWTGHVGDVDEARGPRVTSLAEQLGRSLPDSDTTSIVHGDYRLDNVVLDPGTGSVAAVLDWELTTLGDPLADLSLLLTYWAQPEDAVWVLEDLPTTTGLFPTREELAARYAERTGVDLSFLPAYRAFNLWRLACVLIGVHSCAARGAYGLDPGASFAGLDRRADRVLGHVEALVT